MDAEAVAAWAARPWRSSPIHDDLVQEARIAIWQAVEAWRPELGTPRLDHCRITARRRVIDALRRWGGRGCTVAMVSLTPAVTATLGCDDVHDVEHPAPEPPATLTPWERAVWDGLVAGRSRADIAARRGVTTSQVCRHIQAIRRKLAAELR